MLERTDEFAALVTREMGKRIQEAGGEVQLAASILDYYAKNGPRFLEPRQIEVMQGEAVVENEPIGVILAIEPWNYPLYQVVRVAGPNLVLGNAILLKHAELNPQTALAIEKCFLDAGVPEGVYTNVFLAIPDVEQVIAHPLVQGVTLTGSERAGSAVASLAGKHLKKSVLELGGSDPFIVLDTEDLGRTVKAATMGRMQNSGQACIAAKRLIVPEDIYEPFVEGLKQAFATFSPGDPSDPSTTLAPLSSEQAAKDLHAQIQDAIDKGATVVTGGGRPDLPGAFVEPTILTDVTPEMRAYSEELFGPAAVVYKVSNEDEAVELANNTHVRPRRRRLLQRPRQGPVGGRPARGRHGLRQPADRLLPRAALRRREALRLRPRAVRAGHVRVRQPQADPRAPGEEGRRSRRPAERCGRCGDRRPGRMSA